MNRTFGYPEYKPVLDVFVSLAQETLKAQLVSIVLYGSVARGQAREGSDIDILLVLKEAPSVYWQRLQPLLPLLLELKTQACWKALEAKGLLPSLNVLVLTEEETRENRLLYLDMIEEARLLLDRDGFFANRLKAFHQRLHELGARKIRCNDTWYWDIKPDLRLGETVIL